MKNEQFNPGWVLGARVDWQLFSQISIYSFIHSFGMARHPLIRHSLTRDQTWTPCIGSTILATEPPGKSQAADF